MHVYQNLVNVQDALETRRCGQRNKCDLATKMPLTRTEARPVMYSGGKNSKLRKSSLKNKTKEKNNRFHCFEGVEKYECWYRT